jgi:hypothetical protein
MFLAHRQIKKKDYGKKSVNSIFPTYAAECPMVLSFLEALLSQGFIPNNMQILRFLIENPAVGLSSPCSYQGFPVFRQNFSLAVPWIYIFPHTHPWASFTYKSLVTISEIY